MKELLTAIKARFDGAAGVTLKAQVPGGMWLVEAPRTEQGQDIKTPVIIISAPASSGGGIMGSGGIAYQDDQTIQFSIFVDDFGLNTALDILEALKSLYDNSTLTLATKKVNKMKRQNNVIIVRDPDGGYDIHVDYLYSVT